MNRGGISPRPEAALSYAFSQVTTPSAGGTSITPAVFAAMGIPKTALIQPLSPPLNPPLLLLVAAAGA